MFRIPVGAPLQLVRLLRPLTCAMCLQSVGLFLGVATMNPKTAQTIASVVLMIMVRSALSVQLGDTSSARLCARSVGCSCGCTHLAVHLSKRLFPLLCALQMLTGGFFVTNIPVW